jgi:tripartite-type tricarboxylate transporter receptor subunit TctC
MFPTTPASIEYVRTGKLRPLAVTTVRRLEALRDVPTLADFVPGYEASALFGVGAPKDTPVAIIEKLNKEINAALADPKMNTRLADLGGMVLPGSPADFGKPIAEETEKWAKVVKFSGATVPAESEFWQSDSRAGTMGQFGFFDADRRLAAQL